MLRFPVAAVAGLTTLALASSAPAAVTYAYDNGTMTTAVGPPSSFPVNPTTGWGNYFAVQAGGEVITTLSVALGPSFAAGRSITLWLLADPDNDFDPRNAVPLTSASGVPGTLGGSVFNNYPITPTLVTTSFFILVVADTTKGVDKPAAQDTSGAVQDRSWLFYNPQTSGLNVASLGSNALARRTDDGVLPFRGPWMVRANGIAVPAPASALVVLGAVALGARQRQRNPERRVRNSRPG